MAMRLSLLIVSSALVLVLSACTPRVQTLLPTDVTVALQRDSMRRMETDMLLLYYPEHRKENALRIAQRLETCAGVLRSQTKIRSNAAMEKMVIIVPDVAFNNAFVAPPALGSPPMSVIPTSNTLDFTTELGMPPDPAFVGCHEIVHYVHLLQIRGFWGWMNKIFGNVMSPQVGQESWFLEGMATYYESRLQPGTGRMAWPAWRGVFHAGFAGKRIGGGDLSTFQRPFHWGNHYLVGSHFVDYIAKKYGEETLWSLIDEQGGSIMFPLITALRWRKATKKTLPALIDEFSAYVSNAYPLRKTPKSQKRIRSAGSSARYAVSDTGREALVVASTDMPTRLRVYQDGALLVERSLVDILPPRILAVANPILVSGLSFTGDGKLLYFVALDPGNIGLQARLLRYRIDSDTLEEVLPELGGTGGSVSADGSTYYYASADGDARHIVALDLTTRQAQMIRQAEPQNYYGEIRLSPDGSKLVASLFNGQRYVVQVLDAKTGTILNEVAIAGAVHDPSWASDTEVVLLAEFAGRFQVHLYDLQSGVLTRKTDAPYLALQPRKIGKELRFLNRQGWEWSIDSVPLSSSEQFASSPLLTTAVAKRIVDQPLAVHSDAPYSQFDNLFWPSMRSPVLAMNSVGAILGVSIGGADRLLTHRWGLTGIWMPKAGLFSGSIQYGTSLLAPLEVNVVASKLSIRRLKSSTDVDHARVGALTLSLPFRSGAVSLSAVETQESVSTDTPIDPSEPVEPSSEKRLSGPRFTASFSALESTAYTGPRRGYRLWTSAAYFDSGLSTLSEDITDISGQVDLVSPLPFSKRHTLHLSLRGRRLFGLNRDTGFMEVGGETTLLYQRGGNPVGPTESEASRVLPLNLQFNEPLRGFEDLSFSTDRIAIAELTYRYPIIIDAGFSSVAYLFPSLFFRQLDLQLFGVAATESFANYSQQHRYAVGGSFDMGMSIWLVPFALRYQLARRLTGDEELVHTLSIRL